MKIETDAMRGGLCFGMSRTCAISVLAIAAALCVFILVFPGQAHAQAINLVEDDLSGIPSKVPDAGIVITGSFGDLPDSYNVGGDYSFKEGFQSGYNPSWHFDGICVDYETDRGDAGFVPQKPEGGVWAQWDNMGYDSQGDAIDIRIDLDVRSLQNNSRYSTDEDTNSVLALRFGRGSVLELTGHVSTTQLVKIDSVATVHIYKHGTDTPAEGNFLNGVRDLDQTAEKYQIVSGAEPDVYVTPRYERHMNVDAGTGTFAGTHADDNTYDSGFVAVYKALSEFEVRYATNSNTGCNILNQYSVHKVAIEKSGNGTVEVASPEESDSSRIVYSTFEQGSESVTVPFGNTVAFKVTADEGWHIASVSGSDDLENPYINAEQDRLAKNEIDELEGEYPTYSKVYEDRTLKVVFEPDVYLLEFDMNGHGEQVAALEVPGGKAIEVPDDPVADGWAFGGWYADDEFNDVLDLISGLTADTTAHAKWIPNVWTVSVPTAIRYGGMNIGPVDIDVASPISVSGFAGLADSIQVTADEPSAMEAQNGAKETIDLSSSASAQPLVFAAGNNADATGTSDDEVSLLGITKSIDTWQGSVQYHAEAVGQRDAQDIPVEVSSDGINTAGAEDEIPTLAPAPNIELAENGMGVQDGVETYDPTYGSWTDAQGKAADGRTEITYATGSGQPCYYVSVPTAISYENMAVGDVSVRESYGVHVWGSIDSDKDVKLSVDRDSFRLDGPTDAGSSIYAAVKAEGAEESEGKLIRFYTYEDTSAGVENGAESITGTRRTDTVSFTGAAWVAGSWTGVLQYHSELVDAA